MKQLVKDFETAWGVDGSMEHHAQLKAEKPRWGDLAKPLPGPLEEGLIAQGLEKLWSHQVKALDAVRRGESALVTTPTASGKSLIFQLPILEEVALGREGKALFLYPLKALGQDQKGKFDTLAADCGLSCPVEIYDGDTPRDRRALIRQTPPRVLITNPDMLHYGILRNWHSWEGFFSDLKWIVVDELHTYRGVFGSHFHHVCQRLVRLARELGADPKFIASSATASNAGAFAERLTGEKMNWVRESGAPREERHLLLVQPGVSPYRTSLQILVHLLRQGLKTIVFTKARRATELLYSRLRRTDPDLAAQVACYRAGFLAEERREVEKKLFEGELQGVISTSALEMGVDIGGLDACLLLGYPGSMMALWQRSGRVGREDRESLTILVGLPDALDQYFLSHPKLILETPCEPLVVNPENEMIARGHLLCAAGELPLNPEKDGVWLEAHAPLLGDLLKHEELRREEGGGRLFPAETVLYEEVRLRGGGANYTIVDRSADRVIGMLDGVRVYREAHPGAIYLHGGKQFLVHELDVERGKVYVEAVNVDYFTLPLTRKETRILEVLRQNTEGHLQSWVGRLRVTEQVIGFERKRVSSQEVIARHSLDLPPIEFETVGLWWAAPENLASHLTSEGHHVLGSLHATEHASIALLPLLALCDRGDIGGISLPLHPQLGCGAVFVYDGHVGGVGIAEYGFEHLPRWLGKVRSLLLICPCEEGCPACVQSPKCGNGNRPLDKVGALAALDHWLGHRDIAKTTTDIQIHLEAEGAVGSRESVPLNTPWKGPAEADNNGKNPPRGEGTVTHPRRRRGPKRPRKSSRTMIFDLETLRSADDVGGWGKIYRMGVAIGVVLHLEEGRFETYTEEEVPQLIQCLESAELVVGFNVRRFDYEVLSGYTGVDYNRFLPTLDLCQDVAQGAGGRFSLNHLAKETVGAQKTADGLQSLKWVKEGKLDLVAEYCRHDVEVTRDLYLFGRREGFVRCRNKKDGALRTVKVKW